MTVMWFGPSQRHSCLRVARLDHDVLALDVTNSRRPWTSAVAGAADRLLVAGRSDTSFQ